MSNSPDVAQTYKNVIEEVIRNVKDDFSNMGVDEQVLIDLQLSWEQKLIESHVFRAIDFPITTTRDYNTGGYYYPNNPSFTVPAYPGLDANVGHSSSKPSNNANGEDASNERISRGGNDNNIPQLDGADDDGEFSDEISLAEDVKLESPAPSNKKPNNDGEDGKQSSQKSGEILNVMGKGISDQTISSPPINGKSENNADLHEIKTENGKSESKNVTNNDINKSIAEKGSAEQIISKPHRNQTAASTIASTSKRPPPPSNELGSDLDDSDDEDYSLDNENIQDLLLCQYEKISRVKHRWRGVLRSGIIHINGTDYCFSRATIDFDWI